VNQAAAENAGEKVVREKHGQLQDQAFSTNLSEWLSLRPDDQATRFLHARILTWDQHWEKALAEYAVLLDSSPDNVDYLFGKAQVLVWSGQAAPAIPLLERARKLAPDYAAIERLHARAATMVGATVMQPTAESDPSNVELSARAVNDDSSVMSERGQVSAIESFLTRAQLVAATSMDFLDNGFADWSSLFFGGNYRYSPGKSVYGEFRSTERFSRNDIDLTVGGSFPVGSRWSAFGQGSLGPGADILPQWSAMAGVRRALPMNWGIEVSYRHSEYALTYGDVMALGVERYWRAYRFSYSLQRGKAEGAKATLSHVIRADYYYGDYDYLGFIVANGEEAESVGLNQLLVSDIETYGLMGQHWLTDTWAIAWAADHHKQGRVYTRRGIYVGVKHKF
jgi:YaiO family outer membrane protein